jgi:hypothetical protein
LYIANKYVADIERQQKASYDSGGYRAGEPDEEVTLSLLTFCVLIFKNRFTANGESRCVSAENFDAEIGRKIAKQNAVDKVWN